MDNRRAAIITCLDPIEYNIYHPHSKQIYQLERLQCFPHELILPTNQEDKVKTY